MLLLQLLLQLIIIIIIIGPKNKKTNDMHKALQGGSRGVMVIIVGNGHDTSSNPGRD